MMIIGVDYHPSFQQIAFIDTETGEFGERQLQHSDGEAEYQPNACLLQRYAESNAERRCNLLASPRKAKAQS